jgi:hypothetical protein
MTEETSREGSGTATPVPAPAPERSESAGPSSSGSASGSQRGGGGSSASRPRADTERTLDDVMREPSTTVPDVVVLDSLPEGPRRKESLNPREDLWLSTADG